MKETNRTFSISERETDISIGVGESVKEKQSTIMKCIENKQIDIYQYLALCPASFQDVTKGLLCAFAQLCGIVFILYEVSLQGFDGEGKDFNHCDLEKMSAAKLVYKLLAFVMCTIMSYKGTHELFARKGIHKLPVYENGINKFWARTGYVVNRVVAFGGIVGSFMVIFCAKDAVTMVLSGVGMFALMDLDDNLMFESHYDNLRKECSNKFHNQTETNAEVKYRLFTAVSVICMLGSVYVGVCYEARAS